MEKLKVLLISFGLFVACMVLLIALPLLNILVAFLVWAAPGLLIVAGLAFCWWLGRHLVDGRNEHV